MDGIRIHTVVILSDLPPTCWATMALKNITNKKIVLCIPFHHTRNNDHC